MQKSKKEVQARNLKAENMQCYMHQASLLNLCLTSNLAAQEAPGTHAPIPEPHGELNPSHHHVHSLRPIRLNTLALVMHEALNHLDMQDRRQPMSV
jgi:hypothetical protein